MQETEQLANEHWKFIKELILIQREDITEQDMKLLEFLFKEGMKHSWKHCKAKYVCKED